MDRTSWGALGARPLVFPALALGLGVALGGIPGAPAWPPLGACLLLGAVPLWSGRRVGSHLLLLLAFIALGATLARLQSQPLRRTSLRPSPCSKGACSAPRLPSAAG